MRAVSPNARTESADLCTARTNRTADGRSRRSDRNSRARDRRQPVRSPSGPRTLVRSLWNCSWLFKSHQLRLMNKRTSFGIATHGAALAASEAEKSTAARRRPYVLNYETSCSVSGSVARADRSAHRSLRPIETSAQALVPSRCRADRTRRRSSSGKIGGRSGCSRIQAQLGRDTGS